MSRRTIAWTTTILLLASAVAPRSAPGQPGLRHEVLSRAIRSAIGPSAEGAEIVPAPVSIPFFQRDVQFFSGSVRGSHGEPVFGLAAVLPDQSVIPLGNAPGRRYLAPYVDVQSGDTTVLVAYTLVVAQLESVYSPSARVISSADEISAHGRAQLEAIGRTVSPPRLRHGVDGSTEVQLFVWQAPAILRFVRVALGDSRFADRLLEDRRVLGR